MKVYKTYDIIETELDVRNFLSLCCMTSVVLWSRVQLTDFNVRHIVQTSNFGNKTCNYTCSCAPFTLFQQAENKICIIDLEKVA